jgi:hypothetical protein
LDKVDGATRRYRNLHNEELHNLYYSPHIIRMMKLRMRWAGHVKWGQRGMHIEYWWESQKEEQLVGGRIILK